LVRTAQIVRDLAEPGITLGRVGGDEFALILELPTLTAATAWMEKLRAAVQAGTFVDGGREIRLTISAGVCAFRPEDPSPDATLARADEALYRSKSGGRNLVSVHPSSLSTGGS
jgi:diguanylate cyclase (GGDEF)-like protein